MRVRTASVRARVDMNDGRAGLRVKVKVRVRVSGEGER